MPRNGCGFRYFRLREIAFERTWLLGWSVCSSRRSSGAFDGGAGLGLAITRDAVAHGGTITIADTDEGASFVVVLPEP
jgi:hypothetical protein